MSDKKPNLIADEEFKTGLGLNVQLCIRCEVDPQIHNSYQAIGILNGTSVCRKHMDMFMAAQPFYFGPVATD